MAVLVIPLLSHLRFFTGKTIPGLLGTDLSSFLHVNRLSLLKEVFRLFLAFESKSSQIASPGEIGCLQLCYKPGKHRLCHLCLKNIPVDMLVLHGIERDWETRESIREKEHPWERILDGQGQLQAARLFSRILQSKGKKLGHQVSFITDIMQGKGESGQLGRHWGQKMGKDPTRRQHIQRS